MIELEDDDPQHPPDVLSRYDEYLRQQWRPWAEKHRRTKPSFDFYSALFSMGERRQRLGEVYEIVVGLGLLTWRLPDRTVRRHIITTPAEIVVDASTGTISVVPTDAEGKNRFELDMLEADQRGNPETLQSLVEELESSDPLDLPSIAVDLLSRWMNQANPSGTVDSSFSCPTPSSRPHIALAPAVILRKRGQRNLAQLLSDIADRAAQGEELLAGVISLVSTDANHAGHRDLQFEDPEVYFPLPANEEQRQIVHRMSANHGILVQGPPGTGKSHTIANLISHLLAQGKRVLVTSHTDRALKVLQDKLPDEIKPLCISVLGSDRESIRALEGAVEQISARQADWSFSDTASRIEGARADLQATREELQKTVTELCRIRESETLPVTIGNYRGTRQQIATQLSSARDQLGWIPDETEDEQPPLSDDEFSELVSLLEELDDEAEAAATAELPDPDDLLAPSELTELRDREATLEDRYRAALERYGDWLQHIVEVPAADVEAAMGLLEDLASRLDGLSAGWALSARRDVVEGDTAVWHALAEEARELQERVVEALDDVDDAVIHIELNDPPDVLRARTEELLEHVRQGKRVKLGLFASPVVRRNRELLENVTVDGRQPSTETELFLLARWLELTQTLEQLRAAWGDRTNVPESMTVQQQVAAFAEELARLERVLDLEEDLAETRRAVGRLRSLSIADWEDARVIRDVAAALQLALDYRRIDTIRVAGPRLLVHPL